jgi:tetratricopeptide (TPR) repeat protein
MAMQLGQPKEATEELLEVAAIGARLGRADLQAEALVLLGDIDRRQGRKSEAQDRLLEAERLAGQTDDARLQVRVAFVLSTFKGESEGQHEQAVETLRSAIAIAEEFGDHALVAEGHLRIAALVMDGDFAAAEPELRRCLELADNLGSHRIEAEATSWLGIVAYHRGRPAEAEELCLRARTWFERTGDTYFQVQNIVSALAIFSLDSDRPDEAESWLREALPIALQIGGWVVLATYWHLVEALLDQDRLDDAREIVAFAARNVEEEDRLSRAYLLLAEAAVATAAGESVTAGAAFAEALRLLGELNYVSDEAEARLALGRSLRSFGETIGARTELERARSMFALMGADLRRDAIDAELAELVEGPAPASPSTS